MPIAKSVLKLPDVLPRGVDVAFIKLLIRIRLQAGEMGSRQSDVDVSADDTASTRF